ncbi:MAG: SEC-C metal-binding domain-containing protein [Deltaproteobacteria bacterium]
MLALFKRLSASDPTGEDRFFEHYCLFKCVVDDSLHPLQAKLRAARNALPARRTSPRVGANDPCPCGSGKKYKRCCRP